MHLGSRGIAISLNPSSGQGQRQKPDTGLSEKLRCSGCEICLEIATCRQGIIHGACFSPRYPGKSVLIALGHLCRLVHALCLLYRKARLSFTAIPAHTCQDVEGDERSSQRKLQPASSQNGHVQAANVCGVVI